MKMSYFCNWRAACSLLLNRTPQRRGYWNLTGARGDDSVDPEKTVRNCPLVLQKSPRTQHLIHHNLNVRASKCSSLTYAFNTRVSTSTPVWTIVYEDTQSSRHVLLGEFASRTVDGLHAAVRGTAINDEVLVGQHSGPQT